MSHQYLKVTRDGAVATIKLDREEKRNALNVALRDEIEAALEELEADEAIRVVVLTGGERVFCAGFDLKEVAETKLASFAHHALEFPLACYTFPKPVVVAVAGVALAGGFDLALMGDIILAAEDAVFGHPEISFGVPPLLTPLWRFVGLAKAKELCLLGNLIDAREAERLGLVSRVVPVERLLTEATAIAQELAQRPLPALKIVKQVAQWASTVDLRRGLEMEMEFFREVIASEESLDAIQSYMERVGIR